MKLYNLGKVPWAESQLIYHALALLGKEALILVSPASAYVCIGFHQDVAQEVDLDFCRQHGIPVFRRKVGGGAVFLDGNQLFFQLVLQRDNPIVPKRIDAFYKKFLKPVIDVHHRLGIQASYKPVNDIVVDNRKISGTGAGEIGDCIVFVGNLILDFDYETMSKVLKIPDEKFRDKVKKTIEDNLSTIDRELGQDVVSQWDEATLNLMLAEEFSKLVGPMTPSLKDPELMNRMQALESKMINDDWLYMRGKRVDGRIVKIRAGLEVVQRMHKATGGLIRVEYTIEDGKLTDVSISGDFFCFPPETIGNIAKTIEGTDVNKVNSVIAQFYNEQDFELPGIELSDWQPIFKI